MHASESSAEARAYDVAVIGGGPAGLVAATQAARAGARTLLVEKSGVLGGTTVLNGVNLPGLFHAWGQQVIAGIGWQLVCDAMRENGQDMPDFSRYRELRHWRLQIPVSRAVYAALADEMIIQAGVDLHLHTMPAAAEATDDGWRIALCAKEGLRSIRTRVAIDCTGDANLVRLAGLPLNRHASRQPGTLIMHCSGYDFAALDFEAIDRAFAAEVDAGRMRRADFAAASNPASHFLRVGGDNAMHVIDIDAETSAGKAHAELAARAAMRRIIRFFRAQPGLEQFRVDDFAPECGIRETTTIEGETRITGADYLAGRVWEDSLCYSFYPIDVHAADGVGIDIRPLAAGVVPTIPLGALLPRSSRRLIVAGRCACGDSDAHSAYRVQASCMAMGQVAGAAAALAASRKVDVRDIPLDEIRQLLRAHGAIVPNSPPVSLSPASRTSHP